ncbi:MAG: ABC-type transport auxiliary lipoprotein family protein [Steroidobacteraceae bacterium]
MHPICKLSTTLLAPLLATLLLSSCTSNIFESKVKAPQVYVLQNSDAGTANIAYPVQLSIALPTAAPGLNTNRIAVLRNHNQLDYYYGIRWGGTAPQVVQSFIVTLLQSQQGYKNVVAEPTRIDADYTVDINLNQFQAEYTNDEDAPTVHVTLTATLLEVKSRKLLATFHANANVSAKDNRLGEVVTAFQIATQAASINLSEQLESTLGEILVK